MAGADYLEVNRALWDELVPIHMGSAYYDLDGFLAGEQCLRDFEVREIGDVEGRELLHLQCHFGMDTLAWARLGARVTGLDFSEKAIEMARGLAHTMGLPARFVTSDVYQARGVLDEAYDIVYTGIGALVWLPDLDRWARTVASLLKPGGFLYLAEFHPFADTLDYEEGRTVSNDYFSEAPQEWDEQGSYADPEAYVRNSRSVQFHHPLSAIINALIGAGLRLDFLHEHDVTLFRRLGMLEQRGQLFHHPEGVPRVPLMYTLRATRAVPV